MIIRIVKMTFDVENVNLFLALFEERRSVIRNFDGCTHLELWQEQGKKHVFFTYSHWQTESALDNYRHSDFFKDTWSRTKALFAERAEAWSVERM